MVTIVSASLSLRPVGPVTALVHVRNETERVVDARASAAGLRVIAWPRPGYVIVRGDADRLRAGFGRLLVSKNFMWCGGI